MLDDDAGEDLGDLVLGAVAEEHADELAVLDDGEGERAGAVLHGAGGLVSEEALALEEVFPQVGLGEGERGDDGRAVVFKLPDLELVLGLGGGLEGEGFLAFKEIAGVFRRNERGEIALVVHEFHPGGDLAAGVRLFEFDVGGVLREFRRDEHAVPFQQSAETTAGAGVHLLPGDVEVPALAGDIDAEEGRFRRGQVLGVQGGGGGQGQQ